VDDDDEEEEEEGVDVEEGIEKNEFGKLKRTEGGTIYI
jgi:hypothetical protein